MDAKERDGVVLSDIPGATEDVEAICKDESGVCDPQITQVHTDLPAIANSGEAGGFVRRTVFPVWIYAEIAGLTI